VESFSQTVFFGGAKQKPEIRLCSQATNFDAGFNSLAFNIAYSPMIVATILPCYVIRMLNVSKFTCTVSLSLPNSSEQDHPLLITHKSANNNCLEFRVLYMT